VSVRQEIPLSIVATTPRRPSLRGLLRGAGRWLGLLPLEAAATDEPGDGIPTRLPADLSVEAVAAVLAEYYAAKQIADPAAARVKAARDVLARVPAGTYGSYRLKWGRGRNQMDQQTVRDLLTKLGHPVPTTKTSPVIGVAYIAAPEPAAHAA